MQRVSMHGWRVLSVASVAAALSAFIACGPTAVIPSDVRPSSLSDEPAAQRDRNADRTTRRVISITGEMAESLKSTSPALDRTLALLPARFRLHETAHFVIATDADDAWTRSQAEHLERTYHQFMRVMRHLDVRPEPLREKLVCVLFADRNSYLRFAQKNDSIADDSVAGYYSPKNERCVFYDPRTSPSVGEAAAALQSMQREIAALEERMRWATAKGQRGEAAALTETLSLYRNHRAREQEKIQAFISRTTTATTVHEAIHQLLFRTNVQSPRVQYPLWLSEGLATSFETDRTDRSFGPDHDYTVRRAEFESVLRSGRLADLESLIELTALPTHRGRTAETIYHQSYALVTWMYRYRRAELTQYLRLMRGEPAGRPSAARHREIFIRAFGDIAALERAWLRAERDRAGT